MAWWNCCCDEGCLIYETGFDGTDGDLGLPWCENSTSWSRVSSRAKSDDTNAVALLDVPHPTPSGSMVVIMTTADEVDNSGQIYRIILNVVRPELPDNCYEPQYFYFADFKRLQANTSTITLGICSAGVETVLKTDTIVGLTNLERNFTARLSSREFCASVSNAVLSFVGVEGQGLFTDGYYCGMRMSAVNMYVDAFQFLQHFETNPDCPNCLCYCGTGGYFPPKLKARIYPDPSSCLRLDYLDPCEFEIEYDRVNARWIGSSTCCSPGGQGWEISVACPPPTDDFDPMNTPMSIITGCTSSCGGCGGPNYPTSADCSPLTLTYGPYLVTASDLTCNCSSSLNPFTRGDCNYYVEISEL
jgi:hypothetical protein